MLQQKAQTNLRLVEAKPLSQRWKRIEFKRFGGGENTITAFAIESTTGEPKLIQHADTHSAPEHGVSAADSRWPVPAAQPGSEVTLWGRGPRGSLLPIDEVARAAGTPARLSARSARIPMFARSSNCAELFCRHLGN